MSNNVPLYQQIYKDILDNINNKKYLVGEKLPSENELARKYDVSRITIKSALHSLSDNGFISRRPGKGTFVLKKEEDVLVSTKSGFIEKAIGLIISGISPNSGLTTLTAIEKIVSSTGYSLIIKITGEDRELEERYLKEMRESGVEGIIIFPVQGEYYNTTLLQIVLDDFPIVVVDRKLEGIPTKYVGSDNFNGAKMAIEKLIQMGHRKISVVNHSTFNNSVVKDRIDGVTSALSTNNLSLNNELWIGSIKSDYDSATASELIRKDIENIVKELEKNPEITAFFTLDYHSAELVYTAITSLNKKIPDDYSIICFDSPQLLIAGTFFSHIKQEEVEIGIQAVNLLLKQINHETIIENDIILPCNFVDCSSVKKIN